MSSGGGKGGKKQTETTIPSWVQQPAERNIRRAEQVQQLKYMPYTGAEVAAFTPAQEAAMNTNIGAAEAFGLLAPNTLTATTGMPEATTYANGMRGYGSIGLYDQALAELTARDPANMAAYNSLFGNAVPANVARSSGGGRGGGGGAPSVNPRPRAVIENQTKFGADRSPAIMGGRGGRGNVGARRASNRNYVSVANQNAARAKQRAYSGRVRKYGGDY